MNKKHDIQIVNVLKRSVYAIAKNANGAINVKVMNLIQLWDKGMRGVVKLIILDIIERKSNKIPNTFNL